MLREVKCGKMQEVCSWRAGWKGGQRPDHQGPCVQCQAVVTSGVYIFNLKKEELEFY